MPSGTSPELRDLLLRTLKRNAKERITFGMYCTVLYCTVIYELIYIALYLLHIDSVGVEVRLQTHSDILIFTFSEDFFKHPFLQQRSSKSCKYN